MDSARSLPGAAGSRSPGSGALLEKLALGHAAFGVAIYRHELRAIGRDGIVGAVPYRGHNATAFWFVAASGPLWMSGRLLRRVEAAGDQRLTRTVHRVGLAAATTGVACMPVSGFWGWLAISLRGLRQASRPRR